ITDRLIQWKNKPGRMPLILNGARQVGKTYILKEFASLHFKRNVYINLETNSRINAYFDGDIRPAEVVRFLETVTDIRIIPGETLIIFDEIQSCPRALLSLKAFCEEAPEFYVATAGSLLGVALNREKFSFPVGKVDELTMFPMDFEEFSWAMDRNKLIQEISRHFSKKEPLPKAYHEEATELFKKYLIIGGMPAAVMDFLGNGSFLTVKDVQGRIQNEYVSDMAKYASPATAVKIRACYNSIPAQLAKENVKFQYKTVLKGGTATIFGESIEWLVYAGIVLKCQKTGHGFMPVNAYVDLSDFKLYMNDAGMLTMKSGMATQTILSPLEEDNMFMGMICENYVAQTLVNNGFPLYYWKNENTAELDFVVQISGEVIPVEVKKGKRTRSASFNLFMNRYQSPYGIRISGKNFGFENKIFSVPLYAVWCLHPE
ncbi:MAG TPA: ATP-binding protein, partial [Prolixibacteraceae bacterium]|nr:ATP-binding protein [Prolixibacteraceae bacterium]